MSSSAGGGGGPEGATEHTGNTAMFAIFMLAIYSLGLFPYTIYRFFASEEHTTTVGTTKKKKSRGSHLPWDERLAALLRPKTLALLAAWLAWLALLVFAARNAGDLKPFDPFSILGLDHGANDRDIKKAYRKLSLLYHPDKNPDPAAHAYFASHVAKAYAALTDPISRANYEKYGHPDGPQGMNVGVALPEWMFTKSKKAAPLMLLLLVGGGVLLPMAFGAWHLLKDQKFSGPNKIMNETFSYMWHSPFKVKELQTLRIMPETLICAHEFILLPAPASQNAAVEQLRQLVAPHHPETTARSNKNFWARKPGLVKAHLLVLAHTEGLGGQVPRELADDYKYVLGKCPLLAEEVHKIALYPRPPAGVGWGAPAIAAVEIMQCLAQCLSLADRKCQWSAKSGGPGDVAALLQLPHFSAEAVRRLRRIKPRQLLGAAAGGGDGAGPGAGGAGAGAVAFADEGVGADGSASAGARAKAKAAAKGGGGGGGAGGAGGAGGGGEMSVRDLQAMDDVSRAEALSGAGLTPDQADEASAFLQALPEVALSVGPPEVDGEEGVCEGDPVRVRCRALLRRPAHAQPGFALRGKAVRALRQHPAELSVPAREEGWYALLVDPANVGVFAALPGPRTNLMEAERAALARPDAFAAAAAAMARRLASSDRLAQSASSVLVASGGASVVGAAWAAKCERRRKAAEAKKAAAAAAAAGGDGEGAATAGGGQRPSSAESNKQLRRAASGRTGGGGGGAGGGAKAEEEADEHAALYAEYGQVLDLVFRAPGEGTYNLLVILMSDSYVGADVCVPVKLVVTKLAKREAAATEAAALAAATAAAALKASAAGGGAGGGGAAGGKKKKGAAPPAADAESSEITTRVQGGGEDEDSGGDDDEDDEDDEDEHSYDDEETGSMETGPESDDVSSEGGAEGDGSNSE